MKRLTLIITILFLSIALVACNEDDPQRVITFNIDNGYTITQYEGESVIQLHNITAEDQDGMNLTPFIEVGGEYDLDTPGVYPISISVTDNFSTTKSLNIILEILELTCELDPLQDKCISSVESIAFTEEMDDITTIFIDEFIRLKWLITPTDATDSSITIESSNEEIATVSEYGYVFGHQLGMVTITITTNDGNHSISKTLEVVEKSCDDDPLQDKCVFAFLFDTSRLTTVQAPNQSGTNYQEFHVNNRIYYEIFVRKYADSDGDLTGDFQGIIDTLPYLQQLGIGGLWLMPINPSTSDHGYNVDDYYDVNPEYGTMTEFKSLVTEANNAGIDIIIDFVINHMGAHNDIFQDVLRNGTSSDYYDWFVWIDSTDQRADDSGAWGQTIWYNPTSRGWLRDGYYTIDSSLNNKMFFGQFSDWMPDLNLENPDVINYIKDIAEFWLTDVGVKGFRMDATSHLYALNEYSHITDRNQANIDVLTEINDHIVSVNPDAYVVIEAWEGYDVYTEYFESGVSVFNFQGSYWIKDAANGYLNDDIGSKLEFLYNEIRDHKDPFLDSIFISNHDMDRAAKVLGDPDQVRLGAEILLTQPGNPFIYYGDEVGMLGYRNNMIWGDYYDSLFAQFDEKDLDNVGEQLDNPDSLLNSYIALGTVRNNSLALSYGDFIPYESEYVEGYYRTFENGEDQELVIVLFNFSSVNTVPIPDEFTSYEILYSSYEDNFGGISPQGTMILRLPYELIETLIN